MEMYGNVLAVSYSDLVSNGILTKPTYDKYSRMGKLTILQKGGNGRCALVAYQSLPENIRKECDAKLKFEKEVMKEREENKMIEDLKFDAQAVKFFKEYKTSNGIGIDASKQLEYILNAQVMNAMVAIENKRKTTHINGPRKKNTWQSVLFNCEKLRERCNHTLPKNEARLREKFNQFKKQGYEVLINKNTGNQVARRVGTLEANLLLKLKRSFFPVYTDQQIFDEFNRQVPLRGMKTIKSIDTLRKFLYDPKIMVYWYSIVNGEREFKEKFIPKFKTELPSMPNSLWYSDGTKLNLYYKDYVQGRGWVARTTDVYEIMDAATEMFLGYYIGDGENFYTQYQAYRNAFATWKVKPYEIVTDNQGGHKKLASQGFFKKICHLHKTTMPHNGASKTIENAFGRLQQQVLHELFGFTGQNITAKSLKSRANIELILKNIDKLPTLDDLKEKYAECREKWNNSRCAISETGLSRKELYTSINNPEAAVLDSYEMQELFMIFSAQPVQYSSEGFTFQKQGQEYTYMVYTDEDIVDMSFHMANIGNKFYYRYDPENMTRIELWQMTATGIKYSATATPKVTIHRATQERTADENRILFRQLEENRRVRAAMYITNEDLAAEFGMGEAYTQLDMPMPVAVSKKQMEQYREDMKKGTLEAPVSFRQKDLPELPVMMDIDRGVISAGDYTKKVSNITDIDIYDKF